MSFLTKRTGSAKRPTHHADNSQTSFRNPWPSAETPTWAELVKVSFPLALYSSYSLPEHVRPVEVVKPDWGTWLKRPDSNCIVATWLGHAGAMAEFSHPISEQGKVDESTYMVFDPIFSVRAGPNQYVGPSRLHKSPCQASDLPGCHAAFISHNHYDHLDLTTVLDITRRFPAMKWFVPLGNKAWFVNSGINADNVVELDWWQPWEGSFVSQKPASTSEGRSWFKITCVPAQHNSGRRGFDGGSTLWCGWVVERYPSKAAVEQAGMRTGSVYHAGDTGYRRIEGSKDICPVFKEIGDRFNGFDLSFIPIWRGGSLGFVSYAGVRLLHQHMPAAFHCSPADAVNIHKDVKSRNTIAVHHGTFVGSEQESYEALLEFHEACTEAQVPGLESKEGAGYERAGTLDIGGSQLFCVE